VQHASAAGATPPVPLRFDVTLNLSRLHPAAATGAIECGAIEQSRSWIDANRSGLADYPSVQRLVLNQAHYFGQYARLTFPITGRAYSGTQTFTTSLSVQAQVDPTTHAQYQNPAILLACWLSINGQPAVWDRAAGLEVISSNNFTSVNASPLVTAVGDAGAPIALTAQLSAQGTVFAPGAVAVAADLQVQGPMAMARSASSTPASLQAASPVSRASLSLPAPQVVSPATSGLNAVASSSSGTPALNVATPGAGTGTPQLGAPASGTAPAAKTLSTNVPPVTGLWAFSASAVAHTLFWACVTETGCNPDLPAGSPAYTYEVWIRDPAATGFTLLSSSVQADWSSTPATNIKLAMTRFLTPQTAFRVIRKDQATGLQSTGDFVYAAPAQPVQPTGFTATEPQYGQVAMSWQAVPDAVDYLLYEKGVNAPPARVSGTTTTWKNVAAGTHTYQVATEYSAGFRNTNMPEASVSVHAVPPNRSVPYLTRNNGGGSAALSDLHQSANGIGPGGGLIFAAQNLGALTGWDNNGYPTWHSPVAMAFYGNATELGFGRDVGCWQWPNSLGTVTVGMVTFCLAGNHGTPPGPQLPDAATVGATVAANTGGAGQTYGLIVTSPTMGQFFASYVPDHTQGPGVTPLQLGNIAWGTDWKESATTTLDSEGPKYTPNVCLTCHGGTVNPASGKVTGASLLPIDPGLVVFPGNRAAQEESIRQINAMIVNSMPTAAISDYINGLYSGKVSVPGTTSQANYVPASWSQQAQLFQAVVKSDCLMCHLATPAARNFGSAAGFMQNKAAIYADVCNAHSMPNAEVPYVRFWTSTGALGGTSVNLAGYMMTILGYNSCP
jgi:hypothetical protein